MHVFPSQVFQKVPPRLDGHYLSPLPVLPISSPSKDGAQLIEIQQGPNPEALLVEAASPAGPEVGKAGNRGEEV